MSKDPFHDIVARLESPIEAIFAEAFEIALAEAGFPIRWVPWDYVAYSARRGVEGRGYVTLKPQTEIGPYRVDFSIERVPDLFSRVSHRLVVECDGHEWHHATREQVDRDNARRAYLQAQGYLVLNLSGSALHRDPEGCARQALRLLGI